MTSPEAQEPQTLKIVDNENPKREVEMVDRESQNGLVTENKEHLSSEKGFNEKENVTANQQTINETEGLNDKQNFKPNSILGVTFLLAKTCIGSTIYTLALWQLEENRWD